MKEEDYPAGCLRDVAYGKRTPYEKADLYFPEGEKSGRPCLVEVHGGGWYFGQKSSIECKPFLYGLKRGYVVVSAGYTLSPRARYPEAVEEIRGLIRYLKAHAGEYGLDPDRIALWGGSAGAQLAGLAAMDADGKFDVEAFGNMDRNGGVNACILWYGCYDYDADLQQRMELGLPEREGDDWIYRNYLGCDRLEECREALFDMNPANHVTKEAPPVYLQHGDRDSLVPYLQSVRLYEKLLEVGGAKKARLEILPGYEHADDRMFEEENIRKVYDFLDEINGKRN